MRGQREGEAGVEGRDMAPNSKRMQIIFNGTGIIGQNWPDYCKIKKALQTNTGQWNHSKYKP